MIRVAINIVEAIYFVVSGIIFVDVVLSWVPPLRQSAFGRFVGAVASPMLSPIRKLFARSPLGGPGMTIDFSPVIVLVLLRAIATSVESIISGL